VHIFAQAGVTNQPPTNATLTTKNLLCAQIQFCAILLSQLSIMQHGRSALYLFVSAPEISQPGLFHKDALKLPFVRSLRGVLVNAS
jgi:hypothetical protein